MVVLAGGSPFRVLVIKTSSATSFSLEGAGIELGATTTFSEGTVGLSRLASGELSLYMSDGLDSSKPAFFNASETEVSGNFSDIIADSLAKEESARSLGSIRALLQKNRMC